MTKQRNGFTLVELVIVILVITVLVAVWVVIPIESNRLIGAANKLMFDLRYAQQIAISRQVSCGVSFNISGNSYFVYIGDTTTKATDPHTGGEFLVNYNSESEYKGIRLVSTSFGNLISFDYLGKPYDSNGMILSIQGIVTLQSGSHTKTITIEPNTGEVKIP
jgi:prepilin-type N-terminal cleavage/methylation domain-containing protein